MMDELQQADQQRRNLTADVAHELRTPVHILQGHIEGILDGVYQADEATLKTMLEETHQLSHMIDDLQTITLAEAGRLNLKFETLLVSDLIADVVTSFSPEAESRGIDLYGECEQNLFINGDGVRLDQVLSNLVSNALRYTESGGVVNLKGRIEENRVLIEVRDTGTGIAEEDLPFIFERFYRADKTRNRAGGGVGLGLAIARQLVEAHGGVIEVESQVGKGSTFTLWLSLDSSQ
jgi:two-component system OmpR family sensor kinase/two-component system sensor histidine kinase BaeS